MRKFLLIILLMPAITSAQIMDDFTDGNFNQAPVWQGHESDFIINKQKQLQLYATEQGLSCLMTPLNFNELYEWNFWVKLAFSPSDNNQASIFLVSDSEDLSASCNGYFIKLGETGSEDAIELYRQYGNSTVLVARGINGLLKDAFSVRIKVTRDDGHWEIWADSTGGKDFRLQAAGDEEYWQTYSWFGIQCKYTSSNATKFYFDDIYAGVLQVDHTAPILLDAMATSASNLTLSFSEPMQDIAASQASNYQVDNDFGSPLAAGCDPFDKSRVHLLFTDEFIEGKNYQLTATNLKDMAGNPMPPSTVAFSYHLAGAFSVVINEIMVDPDPTVALPGSEYVELLNCNDEPVDLTEWQLTIGGTGKTLPQIIIPPHGYHILTGTGNDSALSVYGPATAITGLSLLNEGNTITIRNRDGAVIHSVTYSDAWYNNAFKEAGGWSLEQIDPANPCGQSDNWKVSSDPSGGTPGSINSVYSSNPDSLSPFIEYLAVEGDSIVRIHFSEVMDSTGLSDPATYFADQGMGNPVKVALSAPGYHSVSLYFDKHFLADVIYRLTLKGIIRDCCGNTIQKDIYSNFALPYPVNPQDLVINELLNNPRATGTEFVEFFNRSNHVVSFSNLRLACRDATTGDIKTPCIINADGRLMFPGDYMVLTKDPLLVKADYFTENPGAFNVMPSFPSFANAMGTVVLCTVEGTIIDEFPYNEDLHFALLNSTKGVSLERVDYNRPATEAGNWHSAAQNVGFATPGYRNSQFMHAGDSDDEVAIEPQTFSPDNDGFNDQLFIICKFTEPGYVVTIRIYDSEGRLVKLISGNQLAGAENIFTWDGTTETDDKAPVGIYIVYTEAFSLSVKMKQFKHIAVLAGK